MLCAGFGKYEAAVGEIESSQTVTASQLCSQRPPVQPAGDHQVQRQPEIAVHSDRDALADASQLAHEATFHARHRRLRGSQEKRSCHPHSLDRLPDDAWLERANIRGDIRQFRHGYELSGGGTRCEDTRRTSDFDPQLHRSLFSAFRSRPVTHLRPSLAHQTACTITKDYPSKG